MDTARGTRYPREISRDGIGGHVLRSPSDRSPAARPAPRCGSARAARRPGSRRCARAQRPAAARLAQRAEGGTPGAAFVQQRLVAALQHLADAHTLWGCAPVRSRGERPLVGREADQDGVASVAFAHGLAEVELAVGRHVGRAGVADVRVVLPDDDAGVTVHPVEVGGEMVERVGHVAFTEVPGRGAGRGAARRPAAGTVRSPQGAPPARSRARRRRVAAGRRSAAVRGSRPWVDAVQVGDDRPRFTRWASGESPPNRDGGEAALRDQPPGDADALGRTRAFRGSPGRAGPAGPGGRAAALPRRRAACGFPAGQLRGPADGLAGRRA